MTARAYVIAAAAAYFALVAAAAARFGLLHAPAERTPLDPATADSLALLLDGVAAAQLHLSALDSLAVRILDHRTTLGGLK